MPWIVVVCIDCLGFWGQNITTELNILVLFMQYCNCPGRTFSTKFNKLFWVQYTTSSIAGSRSEYNKTFILLLLLLLCVSCLFVHMTATYFIVLYVVFWITCLNVNQQMPLTLNLGFGLLHLSHVGKFVNLCYFMS